MSQRRRKQRSIRRSSGPEPVASTVAGSATLRDRWLGVGWLLATSAAVLPLAWHPMKAQDIWWHLAAGELMLERRSLVKTDPWSFSRAGQPWLNHEWFADLLFAAWARLSDVESLRFWMMAVLAASYLLLFDLLRRSTGHSLASFLATVAAAFLGRPVFEIRPHLYTLLLLVVTLWICWLGGRRALLGLPLLFLLWSNLHSGVVLGLALLAVGLWARSRQQASPIDRRQAVLLLAACTVAVLINPYGIHALLYPFAFATRTSSFVGLMEWRSPFDELALRTPGLSAGLVAATIGGLAFAASARIRRRAPLGWPALWIAAGGTAMVLVSARFVPYFGLALALLIASVIATVLPMARDAAPARVLAALPALALGVALPPLAAVPWGHGFGVLTTLELMPVDSCAFWSHNRLRGNVLTYFGWGGYAIWCSKGSMRPYIDARADTVYDPLTHRRYLRFQNLEPGWESVPAQVGADFVLWSTLWTPELPVVRHWEELVRRGWRLIYRDYTSVLLARADLDLPALLPPPPSAYHDLTLGAAAMRAGARGEARARFAAALAADPGLLGACRNLALLEAADGDRRALRTYDRCRRLLPEPETEARIHQLLEGGSTGGSPSGAAGGGT